MSGRAALGYRESAQNLSVRIAVHEQWSERDITPWILGLATPRPADWVLDVGCGTGKQVLSYAQRVRNGGKVVGVDIAATVLHQAVSRPDLQGLPVTFVQQDASDPFPLADESFDLINSAFALYYVRDMAATVNDLRRVLRPRGRLVVVGPASDNAAEFYRLHEQVLGRPLSDRFVRRLRRMEDEVLPVLRRRFGDVEIYTFHNRVRFPTAEAVLAYYRASALFTEHVQPQEQEDHLSRMERAIVGHVAREGHYTLHKRVVGYVGRK